MLNLNPGNRRDKEDLLALLETVQKRARDRNHLQLVNISLGVGFTDPLGVLQAIQDSSSAHLYLEQPSKETALAAEGCLLEAHFQGQNRWQEAKQWAQLWHDEICRIVEPGIPSAGVHWLFTAPFFDEEDSLHIFVPRWMVSRSPQGYVAMANVVVDQKTPVHLIAEKILAAHKRFESFDYAGGEQPTSSHTPVESIIEVSSSPDDSYLRRVPRALQRIQDKAYKKIVLARALDVQLKEAVNPLNWCYRLRERFPSCITYSYGDGTGQSFLGATPESLVKIRNQVFETEAIAGSAPRGSNAREDARLAQELSRSKKDLHEHQLVIDSIHRRLSKIGAAGESSSQPKLVQLANVQHLQTPIRGSVPQKLHLFDFISTLHPTPAVGGSPREAALEDLPALEPFQRGLYAGIAGWLDDQDNGESFVLLRSASINGQKARFFAGAGIVEGSDPEAEFKETNLKFKALLETLLPAIADTNQNDHG